MPICGSPKLFAAYRVLRRQSVPWHPPCALIRLILPCSHPALLRLLRPNGSSLSIALFSDSSCAVFKVRLKFPGLPARETSKRYRNHFRSFRSFHSDSFSDFRRLSAGLPPALLLFEAFFLPNASLPSVSFRLLRVRSDLEVRKRLRSLFSLERR